LFDVDCVLSYIDYLLSDVDYLLCDVDYLLSDVDYILSYIDYLPSGVDYSLSDTDHLLSDTDYLMYDTGYLLSDVDCLLFDVDYVLSYIDYLLSDVDYLLSDYIYHTRLMSSLSVSLYFKSLFLYILIPLSSPTCLAPFLNTSPILSSPTFIYYGIYLFIHALISSLLFLFFLSALVPLQSVFPCSSYLHPHYFDALQMAQLLCAYAYEPLALRVCAIGGTHSSGYQDCCRLGYDALYSGGAMFRGNLLPHSSRY
jgi:hypothetical protein